MRTLSKIAIGTLIFHASLFGGQDILAKEGDFVILCYHDIPKRLSLDKYGVDRASFVRTIEYFRTHGYHFVGIDDILAAREGKTPLPDKAILLTFDDAYVSFYEFVFPLLEHYRIPSVLSVVSSWVDDKPPDVFHDIMSWPQLAEVAKSDLVEIATHTHDLHKGVIYNPQGNEAAAAANRLYFSQKGAYERRGAYLQRIREDLSKAKRILEFRLDTEVRAVAWPYGKYNVLTVQLAEDLGMPISLPLNDKLANSGDLKELNRYLIYKNPTVKQILKDLKLIPIPPEQTRIIQIDLDMIYDEDPGQTEINLGRVLDRVKDLKVSTVYLQAFADPEGTGDIKEVYFPNRVLPMRADLFNRVVHQLKTRVEVEVYAWMPMLSLVLPDEEANLRLRVREFKGKSIRPSESWYKRLSPFSQETRQIILELYEDLAVNAWIDGVVFQDDGYLADFEDFHPAARNEYKKITGGELKPPFELTYEELKLWTSVKTQTLIDLSKELMNKVLDYRPESKFARIFYAPVLTDPVSEEWFAQNYQDSLGLYDYVVIMAYPFQEKVPRPQRWLAGLVRTAKARRGALDKTVFKVQAYDWEKDRWIPANRLNRWMESLVAAGALHIGYYPDDYVNDQPELDTIRSMMSTEDFPFDRERRKGRGLYN